MNPDGPATGDPMDPGSGDGFAEIAGGCSAGGSPGGLAGLALALGTVLLRRRRR